jgi:outer membrane protein TolC
MSIAVTEGPRVPALQAHIAAEQSALRVGAGNGAPTIEIEREGFKGFFENQLNAIGMVRFRTPFAAPWQWSSRDDLQSAVVAWAVPAARAGGLELAAAVGQQWLELAAETEHLAVLEVRVARLDRGLEIQRARLRVGEVSGMEVTQMELERALAYASARDAEARQSALAARLVSQLGRAYPEPRRGDLAALVAETTAPPSAAETEAAIQASPAVVAARERAVAGSRRGDMLDASAWGRPTFAVQYEHTPSVGPIPALNGYGFQFTVPLPFGAGPRAEVDAQRARVAALNADTVLLRLELRRRIETAEAISRASRQALEEMAPLAARSETIEFSLAEQFRLGAISYLEYIDGLSRLEQLHTQVIAARLQLLGARLEAAAVLGNRSIFPLPAEVSP